MADEKKITKRLVMTFATADSGKNVSLSVDNPKDALAETQIKSAMELVLAANVFEIGGEDIGSLVEAKIVVTNTDEYDLA